MAKFPKSAELLAVQRTPTVVHFEITSADPSGTFTIPVKAGTYVHQVATFVKTAFTTGGANASLKIGDTADDDGFLTTAQTRLQTINTAAMSTVDGIIDRYVATPAVLATLNGYVGGKYYAVDDTIDFVFVAAASAATAGIVKGFVVMSNVKLDGIVE